MSSPEKSLCDNDLLNVGKKKKFELELLRLDSSYKVCYIIHRLYLLFKEKVYFCNTNQR